MKSSLKDVWCETSFYSETFRYFKPRRKHIKLSSLLEKQKEHGNMWRNVVIWHIDFSGHCFCPVTPKGSARKMYYIIATTQPTTQNNLNNFGWCRIIIGKKTTTPPPPPHRMWLQFEQFQAT